jgi:hypothetical protein
MPYVTVDAEVDLSDYIDEFSTQELQKELDRRSAKAGRSDHRIPLNDLPHILDQAASRLRELDEIALAFKLDEIRRGEIRA